MKGVRKVVYFFLVGYPMKLNTTQALNYARDSTSNMELRELVQLHHEVQLLCLQLHVKQLAAEKLLPLLEKLDPSDSAFVPLYRVTHGILCGGGKVFPAMVLDNF
ncbi:hypothetical protein OS493_013240 [Desmophyllum pertusum]|uniref:Uncharacterized protein n=1 Tax=Desmophyllum pertusum TaxID=174260 RepID=A0A9W9YTB6_9CNID|nr:hypothetical protein OS493_013240 [Desmophyllum pertusum]